MTIAESAVLLEFVADLAPTSTLLPKDPVQRAKVRFFMDAVNVKLVPAVVGVLVRGNPPEALYSAYEDMQWLLPDDATYAVGNDFTIADAAATPFLAIADLSLRNDIGKFKEGECKMIYEVLQGEKYARMNKYFDAIKARDSFKAAIDEVYLFLLYALTSIATDGIVTIVRNI